MTSNLLWINLSSQSSTETKPPKRNLSMKIAFQNLLWVKGHLNLSTKKLCQKTVKGQFHVKKNGAKTSIFPPKEIVNWNVAYQTSFQCTKSSKLITFNFKLLHRRVPTNCFLKKVGLRDDDKCSFCNKEKEKLDTLILEMRKNQKFLG